jgi:hypothetical protein
MSKKTSIIGFYVGVVILITVNGILQAPWWVSILDCALYGVLASIAGFSCGIGSHT